MSRTAQSTLAKPSPSPGTAGDAGGQRPYRGARTITICRPSMDGSSSTLAIVGGLGLHARHEAIADVLMRDLAAAETQRHLDLVAFLEEAAHRLHLHAVVVLVNARTQLDFLDLDDLLLLARLGGLLLLGEAKAPVVEDFADGRRGVRRDLDEIEPGLLGNAQRVQQLNDAVILAFGIDQLHFTCANFTVGARAFLLRRRGALHWPANGSFSFDEAESLGPE